MKFLLFAGKRHYAGGGINDLVKICASLAEAQSLCQNLVDHELDHDTSIKRPEDGGWYDYTDMHWDWAHIMVADGESFKLVSEWVYATINDDFDSGWVDIPDE